MYEEIINPPKTIMQMIEHVFRCAVKIGIWIAVLILLWKGLIAVWKL